MKVAFIASEVAPYAKTGGLADVTGSLPVALRHVGVDPLVIMPKYRSVSVKGCTALLKGRTPVHFIENEAYFNRAGLYGDKNGDYHDNLERFSFFCRRALELLKEVNFKPDIIHLNDWQTALVAAYLKRFYKGDPFYKNTKAVFTIHNLAYQGVFPKEEFPKTNLGWEFFTMDGLEFYDAVSLIKSGLNYADVVTTVSPTYASEIQTPEYGYGLDGILRKRRKELFGIVNGIDYDVWDPAKDRVIFKRYSLKNIDDKYKNKAALQKESGLDIDEGAPIVGVVLRLAQQKGADLISYSIDKIIEKGAQFILLGTGDEEYQTLFTNIARRHPRRASINLRYDAILAERIYAGSDMFLMPSLFEPCGLGQLISLKYGTIPIVRATGGLRDTVVDYTSDRANGYGFTFLEYKPQALLKALDFALAVYKDKAAWRKLIERSMRLDFSWDASAKKYVELYKKVAG